MECTKQNVLALIEDGLDTIQRERAASVPTDKRSAMLGGRDTALNWLRVQVERMDDPPAAAPAAWETDPITLNLAKALAVMVLDERIKDFLVLHDRMALKQANEALTPVFARMAEVVRAERETDAAGARP